MACMKKLLPCFLSLFFASGCFGQLLLNDRSILREENVECAYPRLSKDKNFILYQSNKTGNWQLYILEINTGGQKRITSDNFNNNFPDWSADNKYIAFVSDRNGNEEIYMMTRDGKNLRRITNHPARDIHPYFSPDGQYLLFNSTRTNQSLDIFRYNLVTGKTEQLTNTPRDHETCARYDPEIKEIVFLRNNETSDDVFVMNMNNGLTENISDTPFVMDGWPMYSPDGKWIYFSSLENGSYSIYRIKTDGSDKIQISHAKEGEEDARVFVSNDSKTIVYNKRSGKTIEIRMADVN